MKTKETYQHKVLFAGSFLLTFILLLSFPVDASPPGGSGYFHASFGVVASYSYPAPVIPYATRIQMFAYPAVTVGYTSVYDPYYYPGYSYPSYGAYYGGGGYYYSSGYGTFSVSFSFGYPAYYPVYFSPVVYYPPVYYQPVYYYPVWYGYTPVWHHYRPAYCYPYRYPYHYHYPPAHIWSDARGNGFGGHTVYHEDNGWHNGFDHSRHNGYNGTYHHTQRGNSHTPGQGGNGRGEQPGNGSGRGKPANRGSHGLQHTGASATVHARTTGYTAQRNLVRRTPGSSRYVNGHAYGNSRNAVRTAASSHRNTYTAGSLRNPSVTEGRSSRTLTASPHRTMGDPRRPSAARAVQHYPGNNSVTRKISAPAAIPRSNISSHRNTPAVVHRTSSARHISHSSYLHTGKSATPAVRSPYPSVRSTSSGIKSRPTGASTRSSTRRK